MPFKESDFYLRVASPSFEKHKTLETLAMSAVTTQPKLKVHVFCSGIRYGNGEDIFYDTFKSAWLYWQLYYEAKDGENLIPTIHVNDLANVVKRVVANKTNHPYIFAIDRTTKPT